MIMRRITPALFAVLLVSACAAGTFVSPVEVTRFVGEQPGRLGQGTIAVRPVPGGEPAAGDSLEFAAYEQAVSAQLAALGYSIVPVQQAAQVAELRYGRSSGQRAAGNRSPVSVGVGGSTGSYGSGLGVGLGIDLSGPPPEMVNHEIGVTIRDNGTGAALWEGRAGFSASANSDMAERPAAAARLAQALFSGFPGQSGETIEVR